jgi:hypothetical protein
MRKPRIDVVIDRLIACIEVDAPPRPITRLLRDTYVSLGVEEVSAGEYADQVQSAALTRLENLRAEPESDGRTSTWQFNPSDGGHIQGSCYIMEALDGPEVVAAKGRRKQIWASLEVISDLDPLDFEALCRVVLDRVGVHDIELTPRRAD